MKFFFWPFKKSKIIKTLDICSPCDGFLVHKDELADPTISSGNFGTGITILPSHNEIHSPIKGMISLVFKAKNAYLLKNQESDISVLLYVGQTNISWDDEKYIYQDHRKLNTVINSSDLICSFFLSKGLKRLCNEYVSVLVQDENMEGRSIIYHRREGKVQKGELLMQVVDESLIEG